jgi:hypothetical protein
MTGEFTEFIITLPSRPEPEVQLVRADEVIE